MKKKSLLIICFSILALLFSIGGALWLAPINIGSQSGKPTHNTKKFLTPIITPKIDFYYTEGSLAEFLYDNTLQDESGNRFTNADGSWSVDYTGSTPLKDLVGDSSAISVSVTATYTPDNIADYEIYSTTLSANVLAVAKYNNKFYATIDKALSVANAANSGTVYSLPANKNSIGVYNHANQEEARTISTNTEIKSGVTLALPYDSAALDATVSYVFMTETDYKVSSYNNELYQANLIYFAENLTLSNYGTINVAGEVCGGGGGNYAVNTDYANSITAGRHGQINLKSSATLKNYGTLNCYGFINETTPGNASQVILEDKSTATVVFSIVEHRGGLAYFGMLNPSVDPAKSAILSAAMAGLNGVGEYTPNVLQASPFNRFFIGSITSKIVAKYNATMKGHVVLCAGADPEVGFDGNNITTVNLVNSSDALITLQSTNGYLEAKYDYTSHKTDLDIYGDMTLNPLSLSLNVSKKAMGQTVTIKVTLSTGPVDGSDGIFFPICDYYDVSLNPTIDENDNVIPASVNTMNQNIKLLPGSKLTIAEGVSVTAKSIVVYDSNRLLIEGHDVHYTTATPAKFIINGSLSVQNLGGQVKSSRDTASLTIEASNSLLSNEIKSIGAIEYAVYNLVIASFSMPYSPITYFGVTESTLTANGATFTSNSSTLQVGTYNYKNGKWIPEKISITYDSTGGSSISPDTNITLPTNGYTIPTDIDSTKVPVLENYIFKGWYLDPSYSQKAAGQTVWDYTTLYAQWEKEAEAILVEFQAVPNADQTVANLDQSATNSFTAQKITSDNTKATIPTAQATYHNDPTYKRYVEGYYTTPECTTRFDFNQQITESTTVYVKWADKYNFIITTTKGANSPDGKNQGKFPQFTIYLSETTASSASYWNKKYTNEATQNINEYYIVPNHYVIIADTGSTISTVPSPTQITSNKQTISFQGKQGENSCIAAGTLITLADGTQKKVEDIVETDILLVFDHETGRYVESAITFIERDGWAYYNVINLEFSDGTKTRLIYEHGLFDLTLNKYVYIDEFNYQSFVGHKFAMMGENGNAYETVTLEKAYVTNEYTGCFSLVTMYHLNYFIDGLFSMPGGINGLFNYFEYGEGLKYDEEKMQADIEKYGLFTYEDFKDYIPYEIYEYAFPAKYYKVSIAKGLMTWDDILNMIEIYLIKNGVM